MTDRRSWPNGAEWARQDAIALALDIRYLAEMLERANLAGDRLEVARLNATIHGKTRRIQDILREVMNSRDGTPYQAQPVAAGE